MIAQHLDALSGRCAVVAADPLRYGLGRIFEVHMGEHGVGVMVFREIEAAEAWLGKVPRGGAALGSAPAGAATGSAPAREHVTPPLFAALFRRRR